MFRVGNRTAVVLFVGMTLVTTSCQSEQKKEAQNHKQEKREISANYDQTDNENGGDPTTSETKKPKTAYCVIGARENSNVIGAVTFTEVEGGVRVIADVGGLSPGKHGFHIHEHGDCSAHDGSSAGGHFNPTHKKHGGPDSAERHVGDLGNLDANEFGFAHYDRVDKMIALAGENSIIGKSVIVHADPDDLKTDPTGNAGKRIGCGEITDSSR